jgi:hypothetical protein
MAFRLMRKPHKDGRIKGPPMLSGLHYQYVRTLFVAWTGPFSSTLLILSTKNVEFTLETNRRCCW